MSGPLDEASQDLSGVYSLSLCWSSLIFSSVKKGGQRVQCFRVLFTYGRTGSPPQWGSPHFGHWKIRGANSPLSPRRGLWKRENGSGNGV